MIDDDAVEEMQEMDQDLDTMDIDMKEQTDHALAADVLRSMPLGHNAIHRSRALRAVDGGAGIELKRRIDGGGGRGGGDGGGGDGDRLGVGAGEDEEGKMGGGVGGVEVYPLDPRTVKVQAWWRSIRCQKRFGKLTTNRQILSDPVGKRNRLRLPSTLKAAPSSTSLLAGTPVRRRGLGGGGGGGVVGGGQDESVVSIVAERFDIEI